MQNDLSRRLLAAPTLSRYSTRISQTRTIPVAVTHPNQNPCMYTAPTGACAGGRRSGVLAEHPRGQDRPRGVQLRVGRAPERGHYLYGSLRKRPRQL